MNSTLDLKITLSGSEEVLSDINDKLMSSVDTPLLIDTLAASIRQSLIAAGVSADFAVDIRPSQIHKNFGQAGALNADEWFDRI
jgi:hypothetical protein